MNALSERFNELTRPLWRTDSSIRQQLELKGNWWSLVGVYRDHLQSIGHYIEPHRLSRKLDQYVEKHRAMQDDDKGNEHELTFPPLKDSEWARKFVEANGKWIEKATYFA